MKKKSLKIIQEFAKKLPKTIEEYNEISTMRGAEFIKKGITQVDGEEIDPEHVYTSTTVKLREIDHFRRIKRLFIAGDKNAAETYTAWLVRHNKIMAEKYPKLFKESKAVTA